MKLDADFGIVKRKEVDVLSELPSLGSCSTISAALSRNETAQTSYKANRHFLNNSVPSAPPLKSLSGITAGVGGGEGGCSSLISTRIRCCFGLSSEISPDNDPGPLHLC